MNTLPAAVLAHCIYPLLRSRDVAALAQTSHALHAARNFTTAIEDVAVRGASVAHRRTVPPWLRTFYMSLLIEMIRMGSHEVGDSATVVCKAQQLHAGVPPAQLLREINRLRTPT